MRFVLCSILFLLIYSSGIAAAGEEQQINEMLKNGGNVHLNSGIYNIDGPIIIGSNTVLTGEPDTVIRVDPNSGQWYTSSTGIITLPAGSHDISISGFQIDGNCENIAREYANYAGKHDAERLIFLQGSAGAFSDNISIHDMVLHDAYSDGIHLGFCTQANCYNNFISDTQHEGIFYVNVLSGSMHDNKIASITSDGLRCDNCQNVKINNNTIFSYTGNNNHGYYEKGTNGLQIADENNKPDSTANIEVCNNIFADIGLRAIWLTSTAYIHDNEFVNVSGINTTGTSISASNLPTIQQSEKVFSNVFDILKMDYSFSYPDVSQDLKGKVQVISYPNYSLAEVTGKDLTAFKVHYAGQEVTHYLEKDIWVGSLSRQGNRVYLPDHFQESSLKVICISNTGYQDVINFNIVTEEAETGSISPDIVPFSTILIISGLFIFRNSRRMIK